MLFCVLIVMRIRVYELGVRHKFVQNLGSRAGVHFLEYPVELLLDSRAGHTHQDGELAVLQPTGKEMANQLPLAGR